MDDHGDRGDASRPLDRWLREEAAVPAPDRLLEEVFARTAASAQVPRGRLARLLPHVWARGARDRTAWRGPALVTSAVAVVVLVGAAIGSTPPSGAGTIGILPSHPSSSAPPGGSPPVAQSPAAGDRSPAFVAERSHQTCARHGSLTVLPATATARSSAWVTCGADSEEVVIGTDTVTARPGLGAIATDGTSEWALNGDSIVRLNPDRTIAATVRIGTPSAIVVGSGVVWTLDTRTGQLSSIAADAIVRTVTPAPEGRPIALTIAAGSLWVLDQAAAQLLRLDLVDGHRLGAIAVGPRSTILTVGAGVLFVASPLEDTLVRIDPVSGTGTGLTPDLGPDGHIDALAGSPDGLLLGSRTGVFRVDPRTGAVGAGAVGPAYLAAVGTDGPTILALTDAGMLLEGTLP